jgi:hypothetical protein
MAGVMFVCSDDGWESDVVYFHGALIARGFKASFFVHPMRVGQPHKLTWSQIDSLGPDVHVCSHGQYPVDPRTLNDADLAAFLTQSRSALVAHGHTMGAKVFGPPQDDIDARVQGAALAAGYQAIRSATLWVIPGITEFQLRGVASQKTLSSIQKRIDWCAAGPPTRGLGLVFHRIVETDPVGTQCDMVRVNWVLDAIAASGCEVRHLTDWL